MTLTRLILRNLAYFRGTNLAVVAGMAVATAVLTGALMVGDSVRGSLRQLALERLGPVDHALVGGHFFEADLADRLAAQPGFKEQFEKAVPGISVRGRVAEAEGKGSVAGVQINALGGEWVKAAPGQVAINAPVAARLGGAREVILSVPQVADTPRSAALARRGREETVSGIRASVAEVVAEEGFRGLFSLEASQRTPRLAWVDLRELQGAVDQPGRANMLLVSAGGRGGDAGALNAMLKSAMTLEDYGLTMTEGKGGYQVLGSRATYLLPGVEGAVRRAMEEVTGDETPRGRVATHLLSELTGGGKTLHYVVAAGVEGMDLAAGEVAVNAWTAEQLGLKVGDEITFSYYQRTAAGDVESAPAGSGAFRVARIAPMEGIGADPALSPQYKGFTDAQSVADWNPPAGFPFDPSLVTTADEAYWDAHRAAPKVFLNLGQAQELWGSDALGGITGMRVPAEHAEAFKAKLLAELLPPNVGMMFTPVKQQQLAAASGSTDFAMLFMGFSFFLIVAAMMLVALLFRLGVEQRARQFGVLGALGFTPAQLYRLTLVEGLLLALAGSVLGLGLAVGYTALMMHGLTTWWAAATGTSHLGLVIEDRSLGTGFSVSVLVATVALIWSATNIRQTAAGALLAGRFDQDTAVRRGRVRWRRTAAAALGVIAAGLLVAGLFGVVEPQGAFLGVGFMTLVAALLGLGAYLHSARRERAADGLLPLALRNAGARPTRSMLTVGLIAFASFILVTVAAMRQGPPEDVRATPSGTGGYALVLTADIPLHGDLNTPAGRELLGVVDAGNPAFRKAVFTNLRVWQGQDISCLNMTRPTAPRIVGVPESLTGRFVTARPADGRAIGQLYKSGARRLTPMVMDEETAAYIMKMEVGDVLPLHDQLQRMQPLELTATLKGSIFQAEALVSMPAFKRMFPRESGYSMVLIDVPEEHATALARLLESELDEYGVQVESTGARLAAYKAVANTYLSTFQALGTLGLLLGTLGMAVVLLRNLMERRSELALLAALGFSRRRRTGLILLENGLLLAAGLGIGTGAALLGTLPALRTLNVGALALTLGVTALFAFTALALALRLGTRRMTPAALRAG